GARGALHSSPTRRSSDLQLPAADLGQGVGAGRRLRLGAQGTQEPLSGATVDRVTQALLFLPDRVARAAADDPIDLADIVAARQQDRKSTRLNSSHVKISY